MIVQETKFSQYRTLSIPGFEVFECLRKDQQGGGLLIAALLYLDPVEVTRNEEMEILVVQINVNKLKIRIITGYGLQEYEDPLHVLTFWQMIETEIIQARDNQCAVFIELDANAKIGKTVIENDFHGTSNNGALLLKLVERQGLTIGNSSRRCKGVITRERKLENAIEKSVIDYAIFCDKMNESFSDMIIDDERKYVLRHASKKKLASDYICSDHNILKCTFAINHIKTIRRNRLEFFNYRNKESKSLFFKETNTPHKFSSFFVNEARNSATSCNMFFRQLNRSIFKCYKKIRVRKDLERNMSCKISLSLVRDRLPKIESILNKLVAKKNTDTVKTNLALLCSGDKLDHVGFWKLKRKLCPSNNDPPMAKLGSSGNLVSAPKALKQLYLDTYKNRLKHRDIKPELQEIFV